MSENRRRLADHCRPKVRGLIVFIQMRFKLRIFSVDGPRMLIPPGYLFIAWKSSTRVLPRVESCKVLLSPTSAGASPWPAHVLPQPRRREFVAAAPEPLQQECTDPC